jgi:hypothetical protein
VGILAEKTMNLSLLKELGISLHVIATGAGAGLQDELWKEPGSSAYLSGASFPYSPEEHQEILGFVPDHYCSEIDALDLAMAAYMKAYLFGGKKPVGLGLTASVASEKKHRGDHRIYACVMTDDQILSCSLCLDKNVGSAARFADGQVANHIGLHLILTGVGITSLADLTSNLPSNVLIADSNTNALLANDRFFLRPFFNSNGERGLLGPKQKIALMPGGFNPPHEGHFGLRDQFEANEDKWVVFEVVDNPPHKVPLSVQELLKRAKMLRGWPVLFTHNNKYIDKARAFSHTPIIVGADALLRILDPKWGKPINPLLDEFIALGTQFYVADRLVDNKLTSLEDILATLPDDSARKLIVISHRLPGRWDISSTELRNKL